MTPEQQKTAIAVWFANYFGNLFANQLHSAEWMTNYLYWDASFVDGANSYTGCKAYFLTYDLFMTMFVLALMKDFYGFEPTLPIDEPPHNP